MGFISIQNTDIAVGKPGKQSLWQKVKDNLDFLFGKTNAMGLANGSFELDSDADGVPDSWTRSLYPGGSGGFETSNPEHGAQSYFFTHPGGAGNGGGYLDSDYIECSEAEQYSLKHFIRSSVTGIKNIVQIHYYTKAKVFVSSTDLYNATAPDTAASYKSYNFIPPSTARYFKVRLIGGYTDTAVAGSTYFDGVQLDQVIDASVTTAKIAAASVTTAKLADANVTQAKLKFTTGSWSGTITAGTSVEIGMASYAHIPVVGGSNDTNVKWGISDPYSNGGAGSGTINARGKCPAGSDRTGHITWDYHSN